MSVASEAQDAWWPPTLSPSRLGRRWLALWIIQVDSQSTFRSRARRQTSRPGSVVAAGSRPSTPSHVETSRNVFIASYPKRDQRYRRSSRTSLYRKTTAPRRCRFPAPAAPDRTAANAPRIASSPLKSDPSTSPGRTGDGHDANATSMGLPSPCNQPVTLVFSRSRTLFALFLQSQHCPLDTHLGCVKIRQEKPAMGRW